MIFSESNRIEWKGKKRTSQGGGLGLDLRETEEAVRLLVGVGLDLDLALALALALVRACVRFFFVSIQNFSHARDLPNFSQSESMNSFFR